MRGEVAACSFCCDIAIMARNGEFITAGYPSPRFVCFAAKALKGRGEVKREVSMDVSRGVRE